MKRIYYEILLWVGSSCPDIEVEHFEIDEASEALKKYKENLAIAKKYRIENPDDAGLPYISIRKYIYFDFEEYGDGTYLFDRDFSELPKYIKKKCADLLAFELSIDRTIDHLTHGDNQ